MPFSWYHPDVPRAFTNAPQKVQKMYEHELAERAALLMRLGYSKTSAKKRLQGNVTWDFELHAPPSHLKRITSIVNEIYKHKGTIGGGSPSLE